MEPASIRFKNPGAMWGNALAKKWGSIETVTLHDGLGQGNNIAVFPTYVQGIAAQLDLWRSSKNYKNKQFQDAIAIWSGHNHVESYISYVLARVPGMTRTTVMNDVFWQSPMGIEFLKAQAGHEAGKRYPAAEGDWAEAQGRVFEKEPANSSVASGTSINNHKAAQVIAASTTGSGGFWAFAINTYEPWFIASVIGVIVLATAYVVYRIYKRETVNVG